MERETINLAMWSGPRNLSTAMMRSFAQRSDTQVWDEPFYAAYLKSTGIEHPMREEVIADGISNGAEVAAACLRAPEPPLTVFYQKHMTHHMLEGMDLSWIDKVTNAFLIRAPERVLASYVKKHEDVKAEDIGLRMQRVLFDRAADRLGKAPPVVDSTAIRADPREALGRLCDAVGIVFDPSMLSWKAGPAPEDGVWGSHWYDAIWKSTGFAPPETEIPQLPPHLQRVADETRDDYEYLKRQCLS